MSHLLDTTFLVDIERGDAAARAMLATLATDGAALWVPTTVVAEFLAGRAAKQDALDQIRGAVSVVPFTDEDALEAARFAAEAFKAGRFPGWADAFVAGQARRLKVPVVTRNVQHFEGIETVSY